MMSPTDNKKKNINVTVKMMTITWYSYEVITKSRRSFHFLYGLMFSYNKEKRNIFYKVQITPTDQVDDVI